MTGVLTEEDAETQTHGKRPRDDRIGGMCLPAKEHQALSGATRSWKRHGRTLALPTPRVRAPRLQNWENKPLSFPATQPGVSGYGNPGKLIHRTLSAEVPAKAFPLHPGDFGAQAQSWRNQFLGQAPEAFGLEGHELTHLSKMGEQQSWLWLVPES